MRITYFTWGTYGDLRPAIALGMGLKQAGHRVRIATEALESDYEKLVTQRGLDFIALKNEYFQNNFLEELWAICQGEDAIIFTDYMFPCSYIAIEKLKIPCYMACTLPFHQTLAFPYASAFYNSFIGNIYNRWLGYPINWLSYPFVDYSYWQSFRHQINQWRQEILQLPPLSCRSGIIRWIHQKQIPCLYCYSPAFLPKPSNWPEEAWVTGYWFLDTLNDWQPPQDLVDFLAAGSPPVYIGFVRQDENSETLIKLQVEALMRSEKRGILFMKKDLQERIDLPDEVFSLEWVSFDWLFPKLAAIIHHGGLGTTHAALRAGIPSIIIPEGDENLFWGYRAAELSLGPPIIRPKQLSVETLTAAIKTATEDKTIQTHIAQMSQQIQAENGVKFAVEVFHSYL